MGHLYLVGDCDFQVAVLGFIIKLITITNIVPSSTHERKFLGPFCSTNKPVIIGIILFRGSSSRRREEMRFLAGVSWVGKRSFLHRFDSFKGEKDLICKAVNFLVSS